MKPWFVTDTDFSGRLGPKDKSVFMRVCPDKRYPKGGTIFYTGDPATDLHIIVKGQIKLIAPTPSGNGRA